MAKAAKIKGADGAERLHRATYAKDKRKGGYLVRVQGPHSNMFVGRAVPVTMKNGSEQEETLEALIWSGKDQETGEPVTLYSFVAKPREEIEVVF
jgi:hypothetical protein